MGSLGERVLAEALNDFGLSLYRAVRRPEDDFFCSPVSVAAVLGMVLAGARGETAGELSRALGLCEVGHRGLAELLKASESDSTHMANRVWGESGRGLEGDYLKALSESWGSSLGEVDFGAPEATADQINAWVKAHTREMIPRLLQPSQISADMAFVLTNAVVFQGRWRDPFERHVTRLAPFWGESEEAVEVHLMSQLMSLGYASEGDWSMVEIPYAADDLSMVLIKPRNGDEGRSSHDLIKRMGGLEAPSPVTSLAQLESALSGDELSRRVGALEETQVWLSLPRFELDCSSELVSGLRQVGVKRIFSPTDADLGGMTATRPCWVSDVLQQARVKVDEEGTVAAAATAALTLAGGAPSHTPFRADHPFWFAIRDRASGLLLFVGRFASPAPVMASAESGSSRKGGGMLGWWKRLVRT